MLGGEHTALIGSLAAIIGGLVTLLGLRWRRPQFTAEARKSNAEASHVEWGTLRDEIARLDALTKALRAEIDTIKTDSASRVTELDKENRTLRAKVGRLEKRVSDMEAIFKIGPLPPDMQAALDKLDDHDSGGGGK